MNILDIMKLIK